MAKKDAVDEQMETAVRVFAHYLGVDLDNDLDLLYVAEEAFYNLPADWEIGIGEGEHAGIPYFYNAVTGESDWKHPHEEACFRKVKIAKEKKRDMRKSKSKMGTNNNNNNNNSRNEESNRGMNRRRGDNRDTAGVDRDSTAERRGSSADSRHSVTVDDDNDEVVDIQDFNDEDFAEPSTAPHHQQSNPKREANSSISSGPQQVSKHKSVAFGMSEDDFLDVEPTTATTGSRIDGSTVSNRKGSPEASVADKAKDQPADHQDDLLDIDDELPPSTLTSTARRSSLSGQAGGGGNLRASENTWTSNSNSNSSVPPRRASGTNDVFHDEPRSQQLNRDNRDKGDNYRTSTTTATSLSSSNNNNNNYSRDRDAGSRGVNSSSGGRERGIERDRDNNNNWDATTTQQSIGRGRQQSAAANNNNNNNRGRSTAFKEDILSSSSTAVTTTSPSSTAFINQLERQLQEETQRMMEEKFKAIEEANEKMSALRLKHATELQMLRDEVQKADLKLIEERNLRKSLEEKMGSLSSERSSKVRDIEDAAETRLRESVRKTRLETEEEYREKIRVIERKAQDEVESSRVDMTVLKRKLDEAIRDVDHVKRKSVLSKSDGKLEAQAEIDALKLSLVEQEEQERKQSSELRRLREDNASIQGRLAGLIQSLQVAQAESDSLRASTLKAVRDDQEHNGAYQQAMQRILTLDSEVAKYKAECFVLRKDREEQALELRKLQSNASFTGDRLSITESEARRLKSQLHADNARLLSRVTELDALNNVLREQLDRASSNETNAVREVQRQLDQAEGEVCRWRDRVADMEVKEESMNMRIKTQEREIVRVQELVFKKDRQVREEQMKTESIQHQIETIRSSYDGQLDEQKALQAKLKSTMTQSSLQHQQEIEKIEQEVAEKLPAMIAAAVAKAEQQWKLKFSKELSDVRRSYEANIERLTQQHAHQQSQYAEQEALKRLQFTEERVELDKLRTSHRQLKRENQQLDDQMVQLRRELNASQASMPVPLSSSSSTMSRHQSFYNDRSSMSRQRQQPVAPLDLSRSMDMSNMGGADDFIEVSEDPLLAQTMSYIHTQLAQMKSQLSITLNNSPKPIPSIPHQLASFGVGVDVGAGTSVSQPTIYSTSLIDDDLGYNQELHTLSSSTIIHPTITNSSHLLQPTSTMSSSKSINKHSVKFSAEALFNSPEHKTRLGQSQSGHSEAIETLDDFSKSRDATNSSVDIMNGNSYNSHASMGMDGSSSSSSDWLNRSQQPSFISTKSETFNNSSGSSMNAATDEFKAILDGGYYEGYWRAKYMRRSNR